MLDLREFQARFGAQLTKPPPGAAPHDGLARALRIHRNTAMKAAQDALAANYPVVQWLFGEAPFAACAAAFVATQPPREAALNAYGARFADFLAGYPPAAEIPYAADVAALERLCTETLFAADAVALDGVAAAAALDPLRILPLHPAARFAAFASPAVSLWLAHRAGDEQALGDIDWIPQAALVTRPAGEVRVQCLSPGGVEFLTACAAHEPLANAAHAAVSAGADLAALFSDLIEAGAFGRPTEPCP